MNANNLVDTLPAGYRWATTEERARWRHPVYFNRVVWVRYGSKNVLAIRAEN